MKKVGYSLINEDKNEIQYWGDSLGFESSVPNVIYLPNGDHVHAPTVNGIYSNFRLVERWIDGDIKNHSLKESETIAFKEDKIVVTWNYRDATKEELQLHSAKKRKENIKQFLEIDVGTRVIPFWVDAESRSAINSIAISANANPDFTVKWKGSDGLFYILTATEIKNAFAAVSTYIESVFLKEFEIHNLIEDGTITTFKQIEDSWAT